MSGNRSVRYRFDQIMWTVLVLVLTFLPSEIFTGIAFLLSPEGFWQKAMVTALGVIAFGSAQLVFLGIGLMCTVAIWER